MKNKHDIDTFSKLAEGATFYLNEAFHYVNEALVYESALINFSEALESIEPTEDDRKISKNVILPNKIIEILQSDIPDLLTDETITAMSDSWNKAQAISRVKVQKFELDHTITSIEMLGDLNNFGFFIETLINRHLLFLKLGNTIDDLSYYRISIAKILERLIFIFKEDLRTNKVHLNEIVNLFSLRNKTVHYTPDNSMALNPKISEMIQIWNQTKKILEKIEKIEQFNENKFTQLLESHIEEFKTKWI